jgi:hypothetical protein
MRFRIPGQSVHVRIAERVTSEQSKDHYYDFGVEYADGSKDTLGVGGQFATLERLAAKADEDSLKKAKAEVVVEATTA